MMFAATCALCSTLALYHRVNTRGQVMQGASS
jgi:MHS family citrate/tricarballylate:H+ symporter-like MFS transporter